ncbi:phosphatase PAP2 family protein [Cardinium endosymbiont of Philonthus spinipes]|uniref:phosphatase PAP2 family protein n=1 Tax=Cardinium endosymbiont of Philonthus spinipes TaxID=3077941 RepID=UPI00313C6701
MKQLAAIRMIWSESSLFFYLLITLLIIGIFPLFLWDKVSFLIWLKQWHHPIADYVAPYLTWFGDGVAYLSILPVFALFGASCRKMIIMGGSFVCMSIVVQLLKRVFFSHMLRPIALLPLDASIHLVDGVSLSRDLSFPSGHSATIFVLISVIQLFSKNKIYSVVLLGLALAVAYSRIYLLQHFYTDVYIGAWIGTISALVAYIVGMHWDRGEWLDRSIYCLLYTHGKSLPIKK